MTFEEYLQYQDERTRRLLGTNWEEKFDVFAKWPYLKAPEISQIPFSTDNVFIQAPEPYPNLEPAQAFEPYKDLYDRYVHAFDQYESWIQPCPVPDYNYDLSLHPETNYFPQPPIPMENTFLDISASVIDDALSAIRQALPFLDEDQLREYEDFFGTEDEDMEVFQPSETPGKKRVRWPFLEKKQQELIGLIHYLLNNGLLKKCIVTAGIGCAAELLIQQIDFEPLRTTLTVALNALELLQIEIAPYFKSVRNSDDEK